jgi:hypothetical protein
MIFSPQPTAAAGSCAYAYYCWTWMSGVTSPWRPEALSSLTPTFSVLTNVDLRLGDARPGPRSKFSLLRLNRRWTPYPTDDENVNSLSTTAAGMTVFPNSFFALLPMACWHRRLLQHCHHRHGHCQHRHIIVVPPLFKRNIYLSLL